MVVALLARVLAQIILALCFAAGMAASCIIFVLYGPVPVRRKVTIVPRLSPPDPFAQHRAAAIISLPAQPPSLQQQVAPGIAFVLPPEAPRPAVFAESSRPNAAVAVEPPKPAKKAEPMIAPLKLRRPRGESPGARVESPVAHRSYGESPGARVESPVAHRSHDESPGARVESPVAHRSHGESPLPIAARPRSGGPPPLPRTRSARGTERKPRPSELDVTAVRSFGPLDNNPENTLETPLVSFDDDQFLEDGR
jgi:hypothetical protein